MINNCVFCNPEIEPRQTIIFSNDHCLFIQSDQAQIKGSTLEGSGLIVPRKHRKTVFDLTSDEWHATYSLLQRVKRYLDGKYQPQGYNLGWNCGEIGGQHIFHAHFHVLPRYENEPMAGKGIRYMIKGLDNKRNGSD